MKSSLVKKVGAVVVAGAVILLSGCSNVSAAASVGSDSVSNERIQKSVVSIEKLRQTQTSPNSQLPVGSELSRTVLNLYIAEMVAKQAAATKGVTVTDAEVAKFRDKQIANIGGAANLNNILIQNSLAADDVDVLMTYALLNQKLASVMSKTADTNVSSQYIYSFMTKLKVNVNARYGTWDPKNGSVVAADATAGAVKTATSK